MTDEQINRAIADACGRNNELVVRTNGKGSIWVAHCHDYCNDLNAMHQAEKVLSKEQVREYQCYMYDMACEIHTTYGRWMPYSATARYRAEAFLRTLGKWRATDKDSLMVGAAITEECSTDQKEVQK